MFAPAPCQQLIGPDMLFYACAEIGMCASQLFWLTLNLNATTATKHLAM